MKKLLALALALVMCLALAACGTSGAPAAGSGSAAPAAGSGSAAADTKDDKTAAYKDYVKIGCILIGDENEGYSYAHIKGIEETAVALAKFWGVDEEMARRAAILHDCTKYWELEPQLATCEKYGVALDELEQTSVKLLHSKTGAALAEHVFCEPKEECEAIFSHTTGKAGMTKLDKILYLADYMEPTRDFDGVEELRRLVWEDLDQAMILGLEMSIEELKERGVPVHRNTLAALEDLQRRQQ